MFFSYSYAMFLQIFNLYSPLGIMSYVMIQNPLFNRIADKELSSIIRPLHSVFVINHNVNLARLHYSCCHKVFLLRKCLYICIILIAH